MFTALDISTSGLVAQRTRMDVIAGNIAMSNVTEDAAGNPNPYQRRFVVFKPGSSISETQGVHVAGVELDPSEFRLVYDPGHKNAIQEGPNAGYVRYPNIDPATEYVNAMEASRAYEANLASYELSKSMIVSSLKILA
ncbi:MAG: flagellar basal body rod protein FlgC [Phycisphaerae bacterium]|jgi:flagellar basal-body rod protein FlgC|nr:flagellar basal body rod protein FlgC [Phycisphaerae bacterium]